MFDLSGKRFQGDYSREMIPVCCTVDKCVKKNLSRFDPNLISKNETIGKSLMFVLERSHKFTVTERDGIEMALLKLVIPQVYAASSCYCDYSLLRHYNTKVESVGAGEIEMHLGKPPFTKRSNQIFFVFVIIYNIFLILFFFLFYISIAKIYQNCSIVIFGLDMHVLRVRMRLSRLANSEFFSILEFLSHSRNVASRSLLYRYFHSICYIP